MQICYCFFHNNLHFWYTNTPQEENRMILTVFFMVLNVCMSKHVYLIMHLKVENLCACVCVCRLPRQFLRLLTDV